MNAKQWDKYNDALISEKVKKYGASVNYSSETKSIWFAALDTLTPEHNGISLNDIQRFSKIGKVFSQEFKSE